MHEAAYGLRGCRKRERGVQAASEPVSRRSVCGTGDSIALSWPGSLEALRIHVSTITRTRDTMIQSWRYGLTTDYCVSSH